MDLLKIVRNILEKSPAGLPAKELIAKVKKKAGCSRSTIYVHLYSYFNNSEIFRERGRYWLENPRLLEERRLVHDRRMDVHYRRAIKEVSKYLVYPLLRLYDSGEFAALFPEFLGHLKTGYNELYSLFERWSTLPLNVRVEIVELDSELEGPTEEQVELAKKIRFQVGQNLDSIIRGVENGQKLDGECDFCPR